VLAGLSASPLGLVKIAPTGYEGRLLPLHDLETHLYQREISSLKVPWLVRPGIA